MKPRAITEQRAFVTFLRLSLVLVSILMMTSGCSVFMAAIQPDAKDLSVLKEGTPRSHVIAELGPPVWSGEKNGTRVDIFAFRQGYSSAAKAGRAFFHGAADVVTLGLWEVIATPIESIASGTDTKAEVTYDRDDRVKSVEMIRQETEKTVEAEGDSRRHRRGQATP